MILSALTRFDDSVPVEEIRLENPDAQLEGAEIIGEKVTYKLAQRPASYVVLKYVRPVVERKDGHLSCPPAAPSVLGKSMAEVSLLAGLVIDKLVYHLPLYRQHQRMKAAGIRLARSTLTEAVLRTADLLAPICQAQRQSILESSVIAMDETPIRAGRKGRGRMKMGYFWPIHGDRQEVIFPFVPTRAHGVVHELLGSYEGVLLTDGYPAYERYARQMQQVTSAQCWSHTRRQFLKAEEVEPKLTARALDLIGELYAREGELRRKSRRARKCWRGARSFAARWWRNSSSGWKLSWRAVCFCRRTPSPRRRTTRCRGGRN
ncbi:MAG: IS66 family transposase [Acidobacteriota bacterium]|nr:IS66 family transposase [Acidobacteriota bacterium]